MTKSKYIQVKLIASGIGRSKRQKDTLLGLGLRRMNQTKVLQDTLAIRGMVQKVFDLVECKPSPTGAQPAKIKVETYRLGA